MHLIFQREDIPKQGCGLTFDDVLIVPTKSEVKSRKDPNLSTKIIKDVFKDIPVISSNMDTITESDMLIAMDKLGGFGILHRFISIEDQVNEVNKAHKSGVKLIGASIGVNSDWKKRAELLVKANVKVLTVDIAHGHSTNMLDTIKYLKDNYPDIKIISGNVATREGTRALIEAGSDAVKVGIGPGSMCTTRIITGCGVPQLTAIAICKEASENIPLIADGGIRTSGDIVKALAAGASSVMLGSLIAGTIETPGEIKGGKKQYRGMASKAAQVSWRGELPQGMAPEGEAMFVPVKGHLKDVIHELCGGIRSGMSYLNALTLDELRQNARFIKTTTNSVHENYAHGVRHKTFPL